MGVPNSEVGYTSAMPRRDDHEFHKDMWKHWKKLWNTGFVDTAMPYIFFNDLPFSRNQQLKSADE